jgi:hypothetical protein
LAALQRFGWLNRLEKQPSRQAMVSDSGESEELAGG